MLFRRDALRDLLAQLVAARGEQVLTLLEEPQSLDRPETSVVVPSSRPLRGTLGPMSASARESAIDALRRAGASFAFIHGSTAAGTTGPGSDLDVAAWWPAVAPAPWDVALPDGVDLLVLNGAPLELAGRVALHGESLFDDDPPARVAWQAQTRLVYLDEEDRQRALDRIFFEGRAGGR